MRVLTLTDKLHRKDTPMHLTLKYNYTEVARLLIDSGAGIKLKMNTIKHDLIDRIMEVCIRSVQATSTMCTIKVHSVGSDYLIIFL